MEGYFEQEQMDVYKEPYALDVKNAAIDNTNYGETVWTGDYLQMTFMHIPLKLSSIYGPPHHPVGTVQPAK